MPFPAITRPRIALAAGGLAFLAVACNQPPSGPKPRATPTARKVSQALPAVVNGVPLRELAKHALGAAEAYSVSNPVRVRAVVTTQAALYAQVVAAGGTTRPEYVVVLLGHFTCGSCGTAASPPTITTDPSSVLVSTMVLQLPLPLASGATTGVAMGVGTLKMDNLGRVYDLDPYIKSLAGVTVPIGPFPG